MSADRNSPQFWHNRFLQQAVWTREIRQRAIELIKIDPSWPTLEVGSGTGVILDELGSMLRKPVIGLDIDLSRLRFHRKRAPDALLLAGNGLSLPIAENSVALTVCHFLLLWVKRPMEVLNEMVRVTRPGGWVVALAEPDYSARIDFPGTLVKLGQRQTASLKQQGADPELGRQLRSMFQLVHLVEIRAGVLGGEWTLDRPDPASLEDELSVLASDLEGTPLKADLDAYRSAWFDPGRILFVPTFYALGKVPD